MKKSLFVLPVFIFLTSPLFSQVWIRPPSIYGFPVVSSSFFPYSYHFGGYPYPFRPYSSFYQYPTLTQQGYVVKEMEKGKVLIDLGPNQGVEKGDILEVSHQDSSFTHPVTGEKVPGPEWRVGSLQITDSAGPLYSVAEVVEGKAIVGYLVRVTKPVTSFPPNY